MSPVIKESDTLKAPETTARSRPATESAGKAQPIALEIPITVNGVRTVEGSDKREPFSESTKTVMVHGSGAVIRLTTAMAQGQLLFLTNEHTKKEVVCQVVKSKNYRNASGYVELEFTEPAVGFWGMRFPGDRISPGPQAAQAETRKPATGNGAPTPVPASPAPPRTEQLAASRTPSSTVNAAKPTAPAPSASVAKPAPPVTAGSFSTVASPSVPPAVDSSALLGAPKAKPNTSVPPAPIATSLGADTPLIEPWLKKREPAPRVPAAPPSVTPPAPESNLAPVRSFAVERPSEKPASLFAPTEAPVNLSNVDLTSLAPFFEVKPAAAEVSLPPTKASAASDPATEELKQRTARLQNELAKMQFSETASSPAVKPDAEKPGARKPAPPAEMEIPSFPLTEESIETLKTELVHENAVRLVEDPEPTKEAPVLPELSKLDEPVKVEVPAAIPIPALESLEHEEMKIPAWLEPLARNSSAPSSTQELVSREKSKRRAEQAHLQDLVAPLAAPKEEHAVAVARVPQFGSALPFEDSRSSRQSPPKRSGKGMMVGGIAAGILALAGGGWWYMNQKAAGVSNERAVQERAVSPASQNAQTNAVQESVLGTTTPRQTDTAVSDTKAADVSSNAASKPVNNVSSPASLNSAARGMQGNSNGLKGGNLVTKAEAGQPEPVQAVEKKPALGVVHLAAPKISQKQTAQAGAAPDAGILNEEQPSAGADAASLGGLAVASNQPAEPGAPAAPLAVGGDVKQAKLISSVPPAYPALAKAEHVSGAVTIDALIDANGRVTTMKVVSGPSLLQGAAKDALKQWKYQPAMLDGKAVSMHLTVTIQFRLQQ